MKGAENPELASKRSIYQRQLSDSSIVDLDDEDLELSAETHEPEHSVKRKTRSPSSRPQRSRKMMSARIQKAR